ncbi:MAG: hypothetical protein GF329_04275 [Candidatus Lokiarchaeota archaeon]|nr:hypothetical protein [Candidatus Lokiarchaeota archaeon]
MRPESEIENLFLLLDELKNIHKHFKSGILSFEIRKKDDIQKNEALVEEMAAIHREKTENLW